MTARIDRTGMRYGAWLVISMAELRNDKRLWLCRCDCGREAKIPAGNLAAGKSSGCQSCKGTTHNFSKAPEYDVWGGIKSRCYCKKATGYKNYGGHWVPVANLPYTLTSDAGHLMCQPYASPNLHGEIVTPSFAACYWDTPKGRVFSLRSVGDFDVSAVAASYGGGGHKNASGFTLPHGVAP